MATTVIDNNSFVQSIIDNGKATANTRNTGELGKDEFLSLLITQLKYQDPLNPVEDKEFIAQMAQFSTLEQMQNMNASNTAMKGFTMIGKYVEASVKDEATGLYNVVEGHVESVSIQGSKTFVIVDGKQIPIDSVYSVSEGYNPLSTSLSAYQNLIGCNVNGAVYDLSTGEIVGVAGDVVSLAKGAYEDYAVLNNVEVTVCGISKKGVIEEDRTRITDYLKNADASDDAKIRHVEIFIQDANGKRVPVGAALQKYTVDPDGTIKAVLDDLPIPVTSVANIKKAVEAASETELNNNQNNNLDDNQNNDENDDVDNTTTP